MTRGKVGRGRGEKGSLFDIHTSTLLDLIHTPPLQPEIPPTRTPNVQSRPLSTRLRFNLVRMQSRLFLLIHRQAPQTHFHHLPSQEIHHLGYRLTRHGDGRNFFPRSPQRHSIWFDDQRKRQWPTYGEQRVDRFQLHLEAYAYDR